jgi:hypothetical protein
MGKLLTCLPQLTFALVLAGRRCLNPDWHGDHLIVHHQWEHSCLGARSCSKVPIAPMGFSHVWLVVCRAAVSLCKVAQFQSSTPKCIPIKLPMYLLMFKISHRPHGRLTFCSLVAGRRCLCPRWHSFNRQLPSVFQPSYLCALSSSKVPIAPMGFSHVLTLCAFRAVVLNSVVAR